MREMKKLLTIFFLIACLAPAWSLAGESAEFSAGAGCCTADSAGEGSPGGYGIFQPQWSEQNGTMLTDGELRCVGGGMIAVRLPEARSSASYRVVLWDEGNGSGTGDSAIHQGSGQSMTVISR